jgi:D-alanine-D-alanine ligase
MESLASKTIAILKGGPGSEREISLASAKGVKAALEQLGVTVLEVDVRDDKLAVPANTLIAFNLIHGTFGEDGQIQAILDERGIKYTGEDAAHSQLAFDKITTKQRFIERRVPTAKFEVLKPDQQPTLPLPIVIKAPKQGSSVGVHIVKQQSDLQTSLDDVQTFDKTILVEEFVPGREFTVGILGDQVLPVIEILPQTGFYDWKAKYPFLYGGTGGANHACPANLTDSERELVQKTALAAHRALDLQTYSRVDIILSEDGVPYVLEINTIPGMTPSSLLPEAAKATDIDYPALCARIIELSLARYSKEYRR